uniref:Protein kinase domain-containing protein n=1 Tax=Romanomermis culicivorax TaxID=13658 RepID=A0A915KSP5_ROMCU
PENILLQCKISTRIKIIDFGLSRTIFPGNSIQEIIGTLHQFFRALKSKRNMAKNYKSIYTPKRRWTERMNFAGQELLWVCCDVWSTLDMGLAQ